MIGPLSFLAADGVLGCMGLLAGLIAIIVVGIGVPAILAHWRQRRGQRRRVRR